jgi:hypothetical protein
MLHISSRQLCYLSFSIFIPFEFSTSTSFCRIRTTKTFFKRVATTGCKMTTSAQHGRRSLCHNHKFAGPSGGREKFKILRNCPQYYELVAAGTIHRVDLPQRRPQRFTLLCGVAGVADAPQSCGPTHTQHTDTRTLTKKLTRNSTDCLGGPPSIHFCWIRCIFVVRSPVLRGIWDLSVGGTH